MSSLRKSSEQKLISLLDKQKVLIDSRDPTKK